MAHGFQLYAADGSPTLSSESIAYFLLDSFEITGYASGSKTYSNLPAGMTLKADFLIGDITWSTKASTAAVDMLVDGYLDVSVAGNVVSWDWYEPNAEGWDFSKALIRVFGA